MEKVDYDARLHAVYAAGRQLSPDARQTWMEAFAPHLPATRPLVWLDLGSGTGRMTPSLASAFGGPAHGVEPSDKMPWCSSSGTTSSTVRALPRSCAGSSSQAANSSCR